jgi:hypothetical protein
MDRRCGSPARPALPYGMRGTVELSARWEKEKAPRLGVEARDRVCGVEEALLFAFEGQRKFEQDAVDRDAEDQFFGVFVALEPDGTGDG